MFYFLCVFSVVQESSNGNNHNLLLNTRLWTFCTFVSLSPLPPLSSFHFPFSPLSSILPRTHTQSLLLAFSSQLLPLPLIHIYTTHTPHTHSHTVPSSLRHLRRKNQAVVVTSDHNMIVYAVADSFPQQKLIVGYNDEIIDIKYLIPHNRIAVATNSAQVQ